MRKHHLRSPLKTNQHRHAFSAWMISQEQMVSTPPSSSAPCRRSVDNSSLVPRRTNLGHQLLNGWCASQSVLSCLCCLHLHPPAHPPRQIKRIQDTSQAIHQQTVTDASRPKPSVVLGGSHKSTRTQNSSSIPNEVSSPLFNFVDDSPFQHQTALRAPSSKSASHWKTVW